MPKPKSQIEVTAEKAEQASCRLDRLPAVSVIKSTKQMRRAQELLEECADLNLVVKESEERLKELKGELQQIVAGTAAGEGFRSGDKAVTNSQKTRRTLDKVMLLDNGVDPEVIAGSMKESVYTEVRFWDYQR